MSKEVILKKYRHLLGASEGSLEFLGDLEKTDLEELYLQTANAVNGGQTELWKRLARGSNLMPSFIAAKLSENVFGEVVCANVASYMKVKDAMDIVKHLSTAFMAKVTPHLIPEKTVELVNAIPIRKTRKVTRILLKEEDYYTIARFVDTLEFSNVMEIAKKDIDDERVLLRISSYVENKDLVARIFMAFPDRRKLNIIRSGFEHNYQDELRTTLAHLSGHEIGQLRGIIGGLPEEFRRQAEEELEGLP